MINQRYNCFCKNPTVTCLNGGYPNPNDCDSCICQHGYGSRTCGDIDPGTEDDSEVINVESDECQTFEKSLGTDNNIKYNYYKKTWYHFKAPPGKKVQFVFLKGSDADLSESDGCDDNGIEAKITKSKFNRTGFVFCGNNNKFISDSNDNIKKFTSSNNLAMLHLFTRKNKIDVIVKYRFVDSEIDEIPSSCAPVNEGDCENIDTDAKCKGWAADPDEDCEADPDYMLENCPKTCNSCPTCENIQTDVKCEGWAADPDEDCEVDPDYMSENCAKTCGTC
uniref:ShKT domain-containing protein n=1 Tax=Panagrolaimus davidi TaxID=227884 RepID=A0A914PDE0_9BILA